MFFQISSFLFVLITLCLQNQVLSSPAVFWCNKKLPQHLVPLSTISSLDLITDYIGKLPNEQIQLQIFAVNDLTIEDIQRGPQNRHPLLLDAKKDQTNFRFFPDVDDDIYDTFLNNIKSSNIQVQLTSSKIYESLEDALNIKQATIDNVETDGNNVVVIALINHPTDSGKLSRRRRQTNTIENNIIISDNKTCMFFVNNLTWNDGNGAKVSNRGYDLNLTASSCTPNTTITNGNQSSVTLNLVWINQKTPSDVVNMRLFATIIGRYWYLTNATLNNNEYRYFAYGMYSRMDTPPKYSYVCTNAPFVRYDGLAKYGKYNFSDKFYLNHLQFQPFYGNGLSFGPPNYCTSFFTSGIWMGITSSLLCLGILLFGIHRLMSIKSNDRFDDPKGKPLIIKAQD